MYKIKTESRGKIKICADENLWGTVPYLKNLGYTVVGFESGMKDHKLNELMNKNNTKIFITKNFVDFYDFKRKYFTFGIRFNRPDYIMANEIKLLVQKEYLQYRDTTDIILINDERMKSIQRK